MTADTTPAPMSAEEIEAARFAMAERKFEPDNLNDYIERFLAALDAKDAEIARLREDLDGRRHENTALAVSLERAEREVERLRKALNKHTLAAHVENQNWHDAERRFDEAVKVLWNIATLRPATTKMTVAQRMADAARAFLDSLPKEETTP